MLQVATWRVGIPDPTLAFSSELQQVWKSITDQTSMGKGSKHSAAQCELEAQLCRGSAGKAVWKWEPCCVFRTFTRTSRTTTSLMPPIGSLFRTPVKPER